MAAPASAQSFGSRDRRARAHIFEMAAVTAWLLLPHLLRSPDSAAQESARALHDPAGWRYSSFIAACIGQIVALVYIMRTSGDSFPRFGLTGPRRRDFAVGIGLTMLCMGLGLIAQHVSPYGREVHLGASSSVEPLTVFTMVSLHLSLAIGLLAFTGLVYSRLEEVTGNWWGAAVMVTALYCFWTGWNRSQELAASGIVFGIMFTVIRRLMGSVTPSIVFLSASFLISSVSLLFRNV